MSTLPTDLINLPPPTFAPKNVVQAAANTVSGPGTIPKLPTDAANQAPPTFSPKSATQAAANTVSGAGTTPSLPVDPINATAPSHPGGVTVAYDAAETARRATGVTFNQFVSS